jgi:hypothetical protein
MLRGSEVNHDLGSVLHEDAPQTQTIPTVGQLEPRHVSVSKAALEAEQRMLMVVQQHQPFGLGIHERGGEWPADAAGRTRDQDPPAAHDARCLAQVSSELPPAQKELSRGLA